MNPRDRIRRQWTHRRLGLGAAVMPDQAAMDRTDALLTAVGARRATAGSADDAFDCALFDFVCAVDLTIADLDARPIPIAALRAQAAPPVRRRFSWRVLLPAMGGSLATLVVALALLITESSNAPALSATAESKQLLNHAGLLLTAAQNATTTERAELVTEAKADLTHVARLLPLAPPPEQPAIRSRLQVLDRRMRPLAPSPQPSSAATWGSARSGSGAAPDSGSGAAGGEQSGSSTPVHHRPAPLQPRQGSGATETSGEPTRTAPAPTSTGDPQHSGTRPPPPPSGATQYTSTQSGPRQGSPPRSGDSGTSQPPPDGGPGPTGGGS